MASPLSPRSEQAWERQAVAAATCYAAGRQAAAWRHWQACATLAAAFPPGDPRRAASLSNQALAGRGNAGQEEILQLCGHALAAWQEAASWLEAMTIEAAGRSSTFHLLLAGRHKDAFARFERDRWATWLDAGRAVTLFNRQLIGGAGADGPALQAALQARGEAFGLRNPELLAMKAWLGGCIDSRQRPAAVATAPPGRSALQLWQEEQPPQGSDRRRLLAAVTLTALAKTA